MSKIERERENCAPGDEVAFEHRNTEESKEKNTTAKLGLKLRHEHDSTQEINDNEVHLAVGAICNS